MHRKRRRSHCATLSIEIVIAGDRPSGQRCSEETVASPANAHGALILLAEEVTLVQLVTILDVKSGEELQGEVVEIGESEDGDGKSQVGIEFLEPSSRFWRMAFPPVDWSTRSPEAAGFVTLLVTPLKAGRSK
jgi:hypothetical protein